MKKVLLPILLLVLALAVPAFATHKIPHKQNQAIGFVGPDGTLYNGEAYTCIKVAGDTQIKAGPGVVAYLHVAQDDAAPTAGTIKLHDALTETGTEVWEWTLTTAVFNPFTVELHAVMGTGIYVGFTTTNDVNVTVCYQ